MEEQTKPAKKKFYKRWWFWVIVFVVVLVIGASKNADKEVRTNQVAQTQTPANATPQRPEQGLEEQIKSVIKNTGSTEVVYNGMDYETADKDRLAGSKMVTVKLTVSSYWSKDSLLRTTGTLSSNIFQKIYESGLPISDAFIWYYANTKDKYGDEKENIVISQAMPKSTADKIKWASFDKKSLCDFLKAEGKVNIDNACVILANLQ